MKTSRKILTIGNSFTWSLDPYFKQAAGSADCMLQLEFANHGGCELRRHWEYISNEERDKEYNMYGGKKLRDLLNSEQWDIVTIQQASHDSWKKETYQPYADQIIDYVRTHAPSAEIVIQQTWAYRADDPRLMPGGAWNMDQKTMYEKLTAAYCSLAEHARLRIIPTGFAVQHAREMQKAHFANYDPALLTTLSWPDLPSQAHSFVGKMLWKKDAATGEMKIVRDTIHLNERGRYLQACVWFSFLYGRPVSEIRFVPDEIGNADAAFLRDAAQYAVDHFPQKTN